ncbi:uncharacterized protein LOC144376082 [Ictidomys tridecemlineatus]
MRVARAQSGEAGAAQTGNGAGATSAHTKQSVVPAVASLENCKHHPQGAASRRGSAITHRLIPCTEVKGKETIPFSRTSGHGILCPPKAGAQATSGACGKAAL